MKTTTLISAIFSILIMVGSCDVEKKKKNSAKADWMIRIAEIEIEPAYQEAYMAILKEESEASVRLEPGVISIFPMFVKGDPNRITILEIYADKRAYERHLKTPHFQKYKTTTVKMVKSLKLMDMEAMDPETMSHVFRKINQ